MNPHTLIILPVFLPMLGAVLCMGMRRHLALVRATALCTSLLTVLSSALLLSSITQNGPMALQLGGWPGPYGIVFVVDLLGAILAATTSILGLAVMLYSIGEISCEDQHRHYFSLCLFLQAGVHGAFLTGDLFNLYVWYEVMLISSFVLLSKGMSKEQLEGGFKYLVLNLVASMLFLSACGILYGKLGTLNMADVARILRDAEESPWLNSSAILLTCSFGIKAALFPFFFWLPASYHTPQPAITALFAATLTKVGAYSLIRIYTLIFVEHAEPMRNLLLVLGCLTMLTGVLGAVSRFDIRKILSVHIVSQIGYIILALSFFTPYALSAAIIYLVHNMIVKTNLFLIGGIAERIQGSSQLDKMGGLYQAQPLLATLFALNAFSLAGIPPLSGFWAKYGVILAGIHVDAIAATLTAILVGILTLFSMTKIWNEAFWKASHDGSPTAPAHPIAPSSYASTILLTLLMLAIIPFGESLFSISQQAAAQLFDRDLYITTALQPSSLQIIQP